MRKSFLFLTSMLFTLIYSMDRIKETILSGNVIVKSLTLSITELSKTLTSTETSMENSQPLIMLFKSILMSAKTG